MTSLRCPVCDGYEEPGFTTFTVDIGENLVVIHHVPAIICNQCSEEWIDKIAQQPRGLMVWTPVTYLHPLPAVLLNCNLLTISTSIKGNLTVFVRVIARDLNECWAGQLSRCGLSADKSPA